MQIHYNDIELSGLPAPTGVKTAGNERGKNMYENCVGAASPKTALREMPTTAIERDTPEVLKAMNDLRCVIDRYDNLVNRLADRLSCVTVPSPPANEPQEKEGGYRTGLASAISEERRKLRDITNILESLYERIEL